MKNIFWRGARFAQRVSKTAYCLLLAAVLVAWVKPYRPENVKLVSDPNAQLEFVLLDLNGTSHLLKNGESLTIVRGDRLVVRSATLRDRTLQPKSINVVGYVNPRQLDGQDQGVGIDTAEDLRPTWSEAGRNQTFAITVMSKKRWHGTVYLRLVEPELHYAVLRINDTSRILRDGESLVIAPNDLVKVERVESNIESADDVIFQIDVDKILFLRGRRVFATIPISSPAPSKPRVSDEKEAVQKSLRKG